MYDVIIVGGGPAGFTAALYATRAGLDTLVIEKISAGGQMNWTLQIDNYPGFEQGIAGYELGRKMQAGAEHFGAKTVHEEVQAVELSGDIKTIQTGDGTYEGKSVIIATGAEHRHLGLEKEEQYIGGGVAYCATCDGMFYKGKTVAVVGGGNSAVEDALFLSRICKKVILVHRRDTLRATKIYVGQLEQTSHVEIRFHSVVNQFLGEDRISGIELRDVNTGDLSKLEVEGVFISIGQSPATELFRGIVPVDESGYIVAGEDTKTNLPGVFAAGDVRTKKLRQVITAAADGAMAAYGAEEYLLSIGYKL